MHESTADVRVDISFKKELKIDNVTRFDYRLKTGYFI